MQHVCKILLASNYDVSEIRLNRSLVQKMGIFNNLLSFFFISFASIGIIKHKQGQLIYSDEL